ncbi:MAG: secondary thiamine-phosphate synthase enzyme YjbQ [Bacteroidales bacterium]
MIQHIDFILPAKPRGFHLITEILLQKLGPLPSEGLIHLFIKHTSAGLCINENADPSVRFDLNQVINKLIPDNDPIYTHTLEGDDDMPAHIKAMITGSSVSIPIKKGHLDLGTWQGVYLCEFRNRGGSRKITATIIS